MFFCVGNVKQQFRMVCPFGDWQIVQKFFSTAFVLVSKSWIDTFFAFRLHTMSIAMLLALNAMSTQIPGKKAFTPRNATLCFYTLIRIYQFPCINAEHNSAASFTHTRHTHTSKHRQEPHWDGILDTGTIKLYAFIRYRYKDGKVLALHVYTGIIRMTIFTWET